MCCTAVVGILGCTVDFGDQVEVASAGMGVEEVEETPEEEELANVEWLGPVFALSAGHHEIALASAPWNPMFLYQLDSSAFHDPSSWPSLFHKNLYSYSHIQIYGFYCGHPY